ncbi:MAG: hypothetical protein ICV68_05300, partial [Pyrinomonadaceae bacterium]|nr:hypothetical protein [Pyrinomonadaceae bacterium]
MIAAGNQRLSRPFMWLVVATGGGVVLLSTLGLSIAQMDVPLLLLALITINIGTR